MKAEVLTAISEAPQADGVKLPEGWGSVSVSELFSCWGGITPSTSNSRFWNGTIPWLSSKDIKTWKVSQGQDFVTAKALAETRLRNCRPGTVLVVVRSGVLAHRLPVALSSAEVVINQDLKALDSGDDDLNVWLAQYLRAHEQQILRNNRKEGTTVQSIRVKEFLNQTLPIPPLAEQKRIVAKVEELLVHVNAAREHLEKVPGILKRFRQAVLAAACSGRLTEDWRRFSPAAESGPERTRQLEDLRQRRWEIDNSTRRYREPETINEPLWDGLPDSWCRLSIDQVAGLVTDGDHNPPKRVPAGVPHLTAKNVKLGRLVTVGCTNISEADFSNSRKRYEPQEGDVIVTCVGTIGATAIVPPSFTFSADRNLAAIRPLACVLPGYLELVLNAPLTQSRMSIVSGSTAQPHLYLGDLRRIEVPLPPVAEQKEIVRRAKALGAFSDSAEAKTSTSLDCSTTLVNSVLSRAFAGGLVPNEADLARQEGRDYEPASVLLERIRAEREVQKAKAPVTKRRRRRPRA